MKRLKEINNIIKEYPNQMIEVKVNNITKFINYELESDRLAKSYIQDDYKNNMKNSYLLTKTLDKNERKKSSGSLNQLLNVKIPNSRPKTNTINEYTQEEALKAA